MKNVDFFFISTGTLTVLQLARITSGSSVSRTYYYLRARLIRIKGLTQLLVWRELPLCSIQYEVSLHGLNRCRDNTPRLSSRDKWYLYRYCIFANYSIEYLRLDENIFFIAKIRYDQQEVYLWLRRMLCVPGFCIAMSNRVIALCS